MALVVEDIVKNFGEGLSETKVLKGINFEMEQGEFVILNGASGSGKTTLLTILGGLLSQTSGTVLYNDAPLFDKQHCPSDLRLEDIGFIFSIFTFSSLFKSDRAIDTRRPRSGNDQTTKFKKSNTTFEKYWFRRSLECISASVIWR